MVMANSQERTIGQFVNLVNGTGWKLVSVHRSHVNPMVLLTLHPVQRRCTCAH